MLFSAVFMITFAAVNADMYLHSPRGCNNRLDGQNRERKNANRLFDSQNNDRGGYNVGRDKQLDDGVMKYYAGSTLPVEWTNQHECGGGKTDCDIILQYMCDDWTDQKGIRDGTSTRTIQDKVEYHCDKDPNLNGRRCGRAKNNGMHEDQLHYARCVTRERDENLYTADQKLKGNSAKYTRQNPGGTRRGLECPEERDYYPYARPTPWIDIAIMTNDQKKCKEDIKESQNVIEKFECRFPNERESLRDRSSKNKDNLAPLTESACTNKDFKGQSYTWASVPSHNAGLPECQTPPVSRDNHLGNGEVNAGDADKVPRMNVYNWKIPNTLGKNCVLRIRYNISIGDYNPSKASADDNDINVGSDYGLGTSDANKRGYIIENNPQLKPLKTASRRVGERLTLQLAINTAQTGRTFEDRSHKFCIEQRPTTIPSNAKIFNVGVNGKRGNIVQVYPATEYKYTPNNLDVKRGDYVHFQWTGSLRNPNNNDGEGKKGTDKSNVIAMTPKKYGGTLPSNIIGNYGNSYPENVNTKTVLGMTKAQATEAALPTYRNGQGDEIEKVDDDEKDTDISNDRDEETEIEKLLTKDVSWIEQFVKDESVEDVYEGDEDTMELQDPVASPASSRRRRRRRRSRRQQSNRRNNNNNNNNNNNPLLDNSPAYVNLEPIKTNLCAVFHYMCTRNNNFSNRSQKGQIEVKC